MFKNYQILLKTSANDPRIKLLNYNNIEFFYA